VVQPLTERCEPTELKKGDFICLIKDPSGGEIRLGLRRKGDDIEFVTLNPAFDGESRVALEVDADVSDPEWKPFEITVSAHLSGDAVPVVFDLADPGQAAQVRPGAKVTVRITAMSFQPELFADSAAYGRSQSGDLKLADTHFIPVGTFTKDMGGEVEEGGRPTAQALLAGKVLRSNGAGGGRFWWALVESYEGITFDVVLDPAQVKAPIKPGAIIAGQFWLTGRVVGP
jgi:hypothetical protein